MSSRSASIPSVESNGVQKGFAALGADELYFT